MEKNATTECYRSSEMCYYVIHKFPSTKFQTQISSEAHAASHPIGRGDSFPRGKAAGTWMLLLTSIYCRG